MVALNIFELNANNSNSYRFSSSIFNTAPIYAFLGAAVDFFVLQWVTYRSLIVDIKKPLQFNERKIKLSTNFRD